MKILIINGPNLNLLGTREPEVYGSVRFDDYFEELQSTFPGIEFDYYQSNVEGELINKLHEVGFSYDGIVINAGAYTHTSVALADALSAITTSAVEVHISNIYRREDFRKKSLTASQCIGVITGLGLDGYRLAVEYFRQKS